MTRGILCLLLAAAGARAQGEAHDGFEAASVKRSPPRTPGAMPRTGCRGGPETRDPSLWVCENTYLGMLIHAAYDVPRFQVVLPGTEIGPFDVVAKLWPGATKEEFRLMVQDLLTERFHLAFHWEPREIAVWEMVVAKGGPKFSESHQEAEDGATSIGPGKGVKVPRPELDRDGYPKLPADFSGAISISSATAALRARLQLPDASMEDLAIRLSTFLRRPVIDATGLKGSYRISAYWEEADVGPPGTLADPGGSVLQADRGPSLETAIKEQLGLRLVAKKKAVRMLTVDHVDRSPTAN